MKLKKINPLEIKKNARAKVHQSGRLTFAGNAASYMNLESCRFATISINEDDTSDKNLYVLIQDTGDDKESFKIAKSGGFYINMRHFYRSSGELNRKTEITYDISKKNIKGQEYFVFERKQSPAINHRHNNKHKLKNETRTTKSDR